MYRLRLFRWGTYLYGWGGLFLILFKFWVFGLLRGYKGKKYLKIKNNNYICHEPYLRNSIAHDHDFWYTSVKWKYFQVFFSFFSKLPKKWPKMAKNSVCYASYLRSHTSYDCHLTVSMTSLLMRIQYLLD